jgi:hypothetical protein
MFVSFDWQDKVRPLEEMAVSISHPMKEQEMPNVI